MQIFINWVKYTTTYNYSWNLLSNTTNPVVWWVSLGNDWTHMAGQWYNWNIDEFRRTKWVARYTDAFTVPSSEFAN